MKYLKITVLALLLIVSFSGCMDFSEYAGTFEDVKTIFGEGEKADVISDYNSDFEEKADEYISVPSNGVSYLTEEYSWEYGGLDWDWSLSIPENLYDYYKNKPRSSGYEQYALSDYDRVYLKSMLNSFEEASEQEGYSKSQLVEFIVAFVQSLDYTSDKVTTGYDEYPRYPLETLMDNGGDCEDTAILTAALLHELGFGVVLIELPNHMAVGVSGDDSVYGTYYNYNGKKYFYVETTGTGWKIGEIPEEYEGKSATIHLMIQVPTLDLLWDAEVSSYNSKNVQYKIHVDIENVGAGSAKNPKLYAAALNLNDPGYVWDQTTLELNDYEEGSSGYADIYLNIPRNEYSKFQIILYGDNFEYLESYSEVFNT
ncbi:transglutaminase-like domain-containing protein [Methanococcus maripaludis]|jgi:hypothetical protein|uniref:Transglutaminase-like domain-containing protein n=4 Tax=Methanococcus maripaludis TaxID=39152 RepID=A0A8T3W4W1_METMI|nr:transglutaminase-like domain-containing protein [Methanococcus maripaludis]AEK19788.1 hypothetical protein GYY_04565 [Methanococcus maripaludis X1]MBG0768360.1 hypothetical protein [Methanococcus maripaludis]BAP60974.1 hypothetical protein MMKA1_08570 [Methanococcus maripaludis KA1]BAP62933.1 hypothetical protein MMOS7_08470 [Methanococcus maripaludis OS7]